jgi:hypothetical protein
MKNFVIPRTMESGHWSFNADPIEHYPQSRTERAAGVVLAVVIGLLGAAALLHWWAS